MSNKSEPIENIYPMIIPKSKVDEMIADKINSQNLEIIKNKYKEINQSLKHYEKIEKRYAKLSNSVRLIGIGVSTIFGAGTIVAGSLLTSGIAIPLCVPIILGSSTLLESAIAEGALRTYFKKRKHYFNQKVDVCKKYLNRIFLFESKALEDEKVTAAEIEQFKKLVDAYDNEIKEIKKEDFLQEKALLKEVQKTILAEKREKEKSDLLQEERRKAGLV